MSSSNISNIPQLVTLANSASVCSTGVINQVKQLEDIIIEDLGKRDIGSLLVKDDLLKSAIALSHSSSVVLTTGFPLINKAGSNADNTCYYGETDGPMGTIAIATMLQALGKDVTLVADSGYYPIMKNVLLSLVQEGILNHELHLLQYPPLDTSDSTEVARTFLLENDNVTPKYDHLLALERSGVAKDGRHYNMGGVDVTDVGGMKSTDVLFQVAASIPRITTTGIGDGGNELGMGKVYDRVVRDIPHGDTIACVTATDYLITTGVSNWGGYAIAVALYLLRMCPIHYGFCAPGAKFELHASEMRTLTSALPNIEREEAFLNVLMKHQVLDGVKGEISRSIDGLAFRDTHSRKIENLLDVIKL